MAKAPSTPRAGPAPLSTPSGCRGPRAPGKDGATSAGLRRRRRSTKSWSWRCCRRQGRIRGNALDPLTGPRKGRSACGGNDLAVSSGSGPEEESTLGGERAGGGHSQVQQSERGKAMILDLGRLLEQSEDFRRAGNWDANALDCNLQIVKWGAIRDAWKYRLRLGKCRSRSREPRARLLAKLDLEYVHRTAPYDSLEHADAERELQGLKAGSFQAARNAARCRLRQTRSARTSSVRTTGVQWQLLVGAVSMASSSVSRRVQIAAGGFVHVATLVARNAASSRRDDGGGLSGHLPQGGAPRRAPGR